MEPDDITLVTQLSATRWQALQTLLNHWEGVVSAAIYTKWSELTQLKLKLQQLDTQRTNVAIHIVINPELHTNMRDFYPTNNLRNVALKGSSTEYVFLVDVDFIPSPGLYHDAKKLTSQWKEDLALVIPAFWQTHPENVATNLQPNNKPDLLWSLKHGEVELFQSNECPACHEGTNISRWGTAELPYEVQYEDRFEPYIIVKAQQVVPYSELFVGYGFNKASHLLESFLSGLRFVVLSEHFLLHTPHPYIDDSTLSEETSQHESCMMQIYTHFKKGLELKYGRTYLDQQYYSKWREENFPLFLY